MLTTLKISGRIRGQNNQAVQGCKVIGHCEYHGSRSIVGGSKTDSDGNFEITLPVPDEFKSEREVKVSIQVRDGDDQVVISTPGRSNSSGRVDFQIKLSGGPRVPDEPEIYSGGMSRLISAYSNLRQSIDPSRSDVEKSLDSLIGVVRRWNEYRDVLARSCGLEVIQVPRQPRKDGHDHVSRWDEAVLPS